MSNDRVTGSSLALSTSPEALHVALTCAQWPNNARALPRVFHRNGLSNAYGPWEQTCGVRVFSWSGHHLPVCGVKSRQTGRFQGCQSRGPSPAYRMNAQDETTRSW